MSTPPNVEAWVIEANADLVMARYDDTTLIVRTWAAEHALPDGASFNIQYSLTSASGDFDAFSVTGDATPDQIEQLVSRLSRAYDTRVVVRRATLIAVPHLGMSTGEPTGTFTYCDPTLSLRVTRPQGTAEQDRDVN